MSNGGDDRLAAEARARVLIDQQLSQAGWQVQDKRDLNLFARQGIAVREMVMKAGHGRVDYLLYVDKAVVGVIEAKPMGTPLSGVEWQSAMYAEGLPADVRLAAKTRDGRLPFVFEASGTETHFTNGFDPDPRARLIFNVPRPETLARLLREADDAPDAPTWRARSTKEIPSLTAFSTSRVAGSGTARCRRSSPSRPISASARVRGTRRSSTSATAQPTRWRSRSIGRYSTKATTSATPTSARPSPEPQRW